jgi:DNA polymerase-1
MFSEQHENCIKCKRHCGSTKSFIKGAGSDNPDAVVVEEQPNFNTRLVKQLARLGIDTSKVYFTNAVRCVSKKDIKDREMKLCRVFLEEELKKLKPKVILIMGAQSCKSVLEKAGVNKLREHIIPLNKYNCYGVVTYGTDIVQKLRFVETTFERDLKLVKEALGKRLYLTKNYEENNTVLETMSEIRDLFCRIIDNNMSFALDWETKGLKPYREGNHIISCGISSVGNHSYSFLVENHWKEENFNWLKELFRALFTSDCKKIFFNYKFEKLWALERLGADIKNNIADVMLYSYILNTTRGTNNLDHQAFVNFGLEKIKEADKYKKDMTKCPIPLLHKYNGLDAKLTFRLEKVLSEKMDSQDWDVYNRILLPGSEATLKSEMEGAIIDRNILEKNKKKVKDLQDEAYDSLKELEEVKKFEKDFDKDFNLRSTQQVNEILFKTLKLKSIKKTAKDADCADAEVLGTYKDVSFCKYLLNYRKAHKLNKTYFEGIEKVIWDDGLIHTDYNLTFTETGRLSSSSPNLQNMPKRENPFVREMFTVPKDHVLMSFDYAGAEVRCMAMESKDRELIKQVNNDYDMHKEWAERLTDVLKKEIDRFTSKNGFVFRSFYGASYKSIARDMEADPIKIEQVQKEFFKMYPSIKKWQKKLEVFYNRYHFVKSLLGRKRRAPLDYNQMINTPIQSLASDFCLLSMVKASREGFKIPLIIHDDITLYVHQDDIMSTYNKIKRIMTQWDFDFINVKLDIECLIGLNWFEQQPFENLFEEDKNLS